MKFVRLDELVEMRTDYPEAHFYYDRVAMNFTTTYEADRIGMLARTDSVSPKRLFYLLRKHSLIGALRDVPMTIEDLRGIEIEIEAVEA